MPAIECTANVGAFLDTIGFSEGVYIPGSDSGYNTVVGGTLFKDYARHPNIVVNLPRLKIKSSAAGKYQVLYRYAVHYTKVLNLPDFGPESQDKIALRLIKECGAMGLIEAGKIRKAIIACNSRWASFPGNDYGQRQEDMDNLIDYFLAAGGELNV